MAIIEQPQQDGKGTASPPLRLILEPGRLVACRFEPAAPVPEWARGWFVSITRTPAELSVISPEEHVPRDAPGVRGWRALHVVGPLDFGMAGVASALTTALARVGVSVLVVATHDTDWLLVREEQVDDAVDAFRDAGHDVKRRA